MSVTFCTFHNPTDPSPYFPALHTLKIWLTLADSGDHSSSDDSQRLLGPHLLTQQSRKTSAQDTILHTTLSLLPTPQLLSTSSKLSLLVVFIIQECRRLSGVIFWQISYFISGEPSKFKSPRFVANP